MTVSASGTFEEVVVAVVPERSEMPGPPLELPRTARDGARLARHLLIETRSALGRPLRASGPMLDLRCVDPHNMAHLLLDILPLVLFARSEIGEDVRCVFSKVDAHYRKVLDLFGVDPILTSRAIEGDLVHVRGRRGLSVHDLLYGADCPSIAFLPDVYEGFSFAPPRRAERLYIARRGSRALLNHAEVEHMLGARGYETVYMEDYPVAEQFGLASQARHVVAIHGAAMAGLRLNRHLDSVIELSPPHVFHTMFPLCLGERVDRYMLLIPEFDQAVQHRGWPVIHAHKSQPFLADLTALEQALEEAGA